MGVNKGTLSAVVGRKAQVCKHLRWHFRWGGGCGCRLGPKAEDRVPNDQTSAHLCQEILSTAAPPAPANSSKPFSAPLPSPLIGALRGHKVFGRQESRTKNRAWINEYLLNR